MTSRLFGRCVTLVPSLVGRRSLGTYTLCRLPPPLTLLGRRFASAQFSPAPDVLDSDNEPGNPYSPSLPPGDSIVLRPYQESAIQACLDALDSGLNRFGVSSPTGSGKTTMFMRLIPQIPAAQATVDEGDEKGRTLILVGSVELARQAEAAARRLLGDDWTVEVEQSGSKASGLANVTIATWQTLTRSDERLAKFKPEYFKLIIVDEAHHSAAQSYLKILHYFNEEVQAPDKIASLAPPGHGNLVPIIGFSATFNRNDRMALDAVYQEIVFHRTIGTMLQEGWLSPAKATAVKTEMHLDEVLEGSDTSDFNTAALSRVVNTEETNQLIRGTYLRLASERRSTLIFCVDLQHVADLTTTFRNAGIDARSISSQTKPQPRRETLEAFKKGEYPVLLNCEVLTEGADVPEIDCIILARPTKSSNLLAQMVGRGLRLSPETKKVDCHIIDIVDSTTRGLVVSPSLFGIASDAFPEREPKEGGEEEEGEGGTAAPPKREGDMLRIKDVSYVDIADPFRLEPTEMKAHVRAISRNAWVPCGAEKYILAFLDPRYLKIEPIETSKAKYELSCLDPRNPWHAQQADKHYSSKRHVAFADTIEDALKTADAYAARLLGPSTAPLLRRDAPWRKKPASPKQRAMVAQLRGASITTDDSGASVIQIRGQDMRLDQLNAGEVAAIIASAKHGGLTKAKQLDKKEARLEKMQRAAEDKLALVAAKKAEREAQRSAAKQARRNSGNLPLPDET